MTQPGLRLPRPLLSVLSLFPHVGSRVLAGVRRCAVWWLDELCYKKAMTQGADGLPLLYASFCYLLFGHMYTPRHLLALHFLQLY